MEFTNLSEAEQVKLEAVCLELKKVAGLTLHLVGSWLWIGGETKANKETLKACGCRWARKKQMWYFNPSKRFYNPKPKEYSEIVAKYGDVTL